MSRPLVDLRAFLDVLRREGELVEVDAQVDPDLEAVGVEGLNQWGIELEQRLAAGTHHIAAGRAGGGRLPAGLDVLCQAGGVEAAPAFAIDSDEVGVAEAAVGARARDRRLGPRAGH